MHGGRQFGVDETHGILARAGLGRMSSDGLGWTALYASEQRESPYEDVFPAVDDALIVLHLDGPVAIEREFSDGAGRTVVSPGGLHMIPPGVGFRVRLCGVLSTLHLYVRRAVLDEVVVECGCGDPGSLELLPRFGDVDPVLERLLHGVRDVLDDGHPTGRCHADHLARAIAARLIRRHSAASGDDARPPAAGDLVAPDLARAIDFMRANLHHAIGLADIAAETRQSPGHFARRFRASTGLAPHQYLLKMRTDRAADCLARPKPPLAEIAFACGFANQEHLTRLFKRRFGTTPGAYRKARLD